VGGASADSPRRLAFVGPLSEIDACLEPGVHALVATRFVAAGGRALDALGAFAPDVIVAFDPDPGLSGGLPDFGATTVAYVTRTSGTADLTGYDRVVVADRAAVAERGANVGIWRAVPLPVADRLFGRVKPADPSVAPVVLGGSARRRKRLARGTAEALSCALVGASGDARELAEAWITVNLHDDRDISFEHRVAVRLAAGHLVLSEPLHPRHGLEPGIDYVEFTNGRQLGRLVAAARHDPRAAQWLRARGRHKAEHFRASRVWPRLVEDVLADVRAFGAGRAA